VSGQLAKFSHGACGAQSVSKMTLRVLTARNQSTAKPPVGLAVVGASEMANNIEPNYWKYLCLLGPLNIEALIDSFVPQATHLNVTSYARI